MQLDEPAAARSQHVHRVEQARPGIAAWELDLEAVGALVFSQRHDVGGRVAEPLAHLLVRAGGGGAPAGTEEAGALFRSKDVGETWERVDIGDTPPRRMF